MQMRRQDIPSVIHRIRWMSVLITLLVLGAVVWVLVDHSAYTAALVLITAAAVLAYIGRSGW